jgi:hypothetical protein
MSEYAFSETQGFRTRWAWAAVIVFNVFFLYAIIQQVVMGKPFGSKPASNETLVLIGLVPFVFLLFLLSIRLKTSYDTEAIHYRFYPFQFKTTTIGWRELQDAYLRDYRSFYEYGGWGIRKGSVKYGDAINTSASCRTGLQLVFHNGKKLLIGTREPEQIKKILEKVIAEGKINRQV